MALEIEHKYLVEGGGYLDLETERLEISQGYLQRQPERTVRVRTVGDKGYITVKGLTQGCVRKEFEYEIPHSDAVQILEMCLPPILSKTRHIVEYEGKRWEVDEFHGSLAPLVTAEIELSSPDETYERPPFLGRDVTGDPAYYNSNLGKSL